MSHSPLRPLAPSSSALVLGLLSIASLLGACGGDVSLAGQGGGPGADAGDAPTCDYVTIRDLVTKASPCFGGTIGSDATWANLYLGYAVLLSTCAAPGSGSLQAQEAITKPAMAAVAAAPCTSAEPIYIEGPMQSEAREMWNAIQAACPAAYQSPRPPFKITLDANGKVASVTADPLQLPPNSNPGVVTPELVDCMMMTLTSHTFSCLSNFDVCPGNGGDP